MHPISVVAGVAMVLAASTGLTPRAAGTAPPEGAQSPRAGHYIVVMDEQAAPGDRAAAERQARAGGGQVRFRYGAALHGFAARLPDAAVAALRRNPHVRFVEPDAKLHVTGLDLAAPWGLDRIDQRSLPLNGRYRYEHTAAGVTAYIIDTGIRRRHTQFGGRVAGGFTAIADGRGTKDCNGHGTHVAGIVGSSRYGVAKEVTLRPVRVLNCRGSGSVSNVIAGVDWVTDRHVAGTPAVANISIGGDPSRTLDAAVANSILEGVTYTISAGNNGDDACTYSPARVQTAVTVGATRKSDARSSFSNTGRCLDLFAPGSGIVSTWSTSNTATGTLSGTSMAAPHVAGAAALILERLPTATPDVVADTLLRSATAGAVTGRGADSPNLLLYTRGTAPASTG